MLTCQTWFLLTLIAPPSHGVSCKIPNPRNVQHYQSVFKGVTGACQGRLLIRRTVVVNVKMSSLVDIPLCQKRLGSCNEDLWTFLDVSLFWLLMICRWKGCWCCWCMMFIWRRFIGVLTLSVAAICRCCWTVINLLIIEPEFSVYLGCYRRI